MALVDTTRRAPAGAIPTFLTSFVLSLRDWNDARITRRALNKLSDRELDDIGLCRADIVNI
ncbi:DUF1127 domain-containing protein [Falsirhodobacter xinxiangensis]|uniref:DUF1127 domain-containing protein n=1 Tax=Falsirhodobacter xinxiangensis TaxID=2530049 RepID=UPI0010AB3CF2|nr:DUF1127 domain-containing protein [Rhodobacter xinxiangensis]